MHEADARTRLAQMVAQTSEPALSNAELQSLLDMHRTPDMYLADADRYVSWAAGAAYAVGDYVVPTERNGHVYRVTVSDGLAGSVEPVWGTTSGAAVTADGVEYTEDGVAPWLGEWSLMAAAAEGWRWKAGKVAGRFTFSSDVNSFQRRQMHEMCLQMADQYSKGGGTIGVVSGDYAYDPVIGNLNGAV